MGSSADFYRERPILGPRANGAASSWPVRYAPIRIVADHSVKGVKTCHTTRSATGFTRCQPSKHATHDEPDALLIVTPWQVMEVVPTVLLAWPVPPTPVVLQFKELVTPVPA